MPPRRASGITVVPANHASWDDVQAVFGTAGYPFHCQCQRFKLRGRVWWDMPREERAARLREDTDCGHPESDHTSGLVAYLDGEPVGWCAVEPRTEYEKLLSSRIVWTGRTEDKTDGNVWSIVCFATRAGYRRRGITYALAAAAVDYARERGARAIEAYPIFTTAREDITWGEVHVGSHKVFRAVGFREVTRPTKRRAVMRLDFDG